MKDDSFKTIELAFYYVMIFFILREWLMPIMLLTGTGYTELIMLFIVLCLLIALFRLPLYLSWFIKIYYIAWFIISVFSDFPQFSKEGLQFLLNEIADNFILMCEGDYFNLSNAFQSILFFILIWMFIYLIHYWVTVKKSIFFFLVLTMTFITTLDTFTEYDGTVAIVEVVILGLTMMVLLLIKRLRIQSGVIFNQNKLLMATLPAVLIVFFISTIAVFIPKAGPQWPDPVPYLMSAVGQGEGIGTKISKVGYDEDDSKLGGSFVADDTVVFWAYSAQKQYWRVETKDTYTSKGWESSQEGDAVQYVSGDTIHHSLAVGPSENRQFAHVEMRYPYDFIVQPYGMIVAYVDPEIERQTLLSMNQQTEKISTYVNGEKTAIKRYHVEYSPYEYLYSDLAQTIEQKIDPTIQQRYLQLPDTLPQRVMDLAQEIVTGKENVYDQAHAIESYFATNGFRYETKGVPVPKEGQDYVDQFLFESKIGYCDNFSTSMVVMLRAVGIPARWVKGFAGGDLIASDGELNTYEVTNNHAHSWVEAYIPKVGWVPFEPTIGFSANRNIDYDYETDAYQEELLTVDEDTKPEEQDEKEETINQNNGQEFVGILKDLKLIKYIFIALVIVFVMGLIVLFVFRKKWIPKMQVKWLQNQDLDEKTFENYYMKLIKMLELKGLKMKKGQTLTSFAKEVDEEFSTHHMSTITKAYERYIYGNNANVDYDKLKECWEYLINRCKG